nr:hypothetical protein [Halococcoides cellulosivorans]
MDGDPREPTTGKDPDPEPEEYPINKTERTARSDEKSADGARQDGPPGRRRFDNAIRPIVFGDQSRVQISDFVLLNHSAQQFVVLPAIRPIPPDCLVHLSSDHPRRVGNRIVQRQSSADRSRLDGLSLERRRPGIGIFLPKETPDETDRRIPLQKFDLPLEPGWVGHGVRVHTSDESTARFLQPDIQRIDDIAVLLKYYTIIGMIGNDFARSVGRAAIDDDHFDVRNGLCQRGVE